ncbi:MAG: SDR family NAD(P)-dependent oxidoreductase [Bacteroidota bacterium]
MKSFKQKYGDWALILGAAEGLGAAFAKEIAHKGLNLVLVDVQKSKLNSLSEELSSIYKIKVENRIVDLAQENQVRFLIEELVDFDIGLVIYNATFSPIKEFTDVDLSDHEKLIQINLKSTLLITDYFSKRMKEQGEGGILLMSSMSGLQGTAMVAHYAASKAYLMVLAEGLWYELKDYGVDVLACIAGATGTQNYYDTKPNRKGLIIPPIMTPEDVARQSLNKLGKQPSYIPGFWNRFAVWFSKLLFGRKTSTILVSENLVRMYGNKKATH